MRTVGALRALPQNLRLPQKEPVYPQEAFLPIGGSVLPEFVQKPCRLFFHAPEFAVRDRYMQNREEFLSRYHNCSNVETIFHMIKSKFGQRLRSKTMTAQINEALCKVCVIICVG